MMTADRRALERLLVRFEANADEERARVAAQEWDEGMARGRMTAYEGAANWVRKELNAIRATAEPSPEPAAAREAVVEAARTAVKELGVPGEGYPAPVANAHSILTAALARLEAEEGGVTIIEDEWACPGCEDASATRDDGMFQFCDRHAAEFDAEEAGDG